MNTDTGRIYLPEEFAERMRVRDEHREFELLRDDAMQRLDDAEQREFEEAFAAGKIVSISDAVAEQVRLGQAEQERRRKRKAARAARKANR